LMRLKPISVCMYIDTYIDIHTIIAKKIKCQ